MKNPTGYQPERERAVVNESILGQVRCEKCGSYMEAESYACETCAELSKMDGASGRMKCDTCGYGKMCGLRDRYSEMVSTIAQLVDTKEPDYILLCHRAAGLFNSCVHYERRP